MILSPTIPSYSNCPLYFFVQPSVKILTQPNFFFFSLLPFFFPSFSPSMAAFHFETSFWSQKQPEQPLPDFTTGFQVLHRKLNQSKVENDEIIQFFKDRIAVEEQYANRLSQTRTLRTSGFDGDDGATLKSCFQLLKQSNQQQSDQHAALTDSLTTTVLKPLVQFQDEYKLRVSTSKQALESSIRQLDGLAKEADRAKQVYHRRCREANVAEEQALNKAATANINNGPISPTTESEQTNNNNSNNSDNDNGNSNSSSPSSVGSGGGESIQLGNQVLTRPEYEQLIHNMHQSIPMQDYRVPILGKYQNTSTGENIARWLQQHLPQCKDSPAMADVVGQQLIQPYGALRLVGQRGNKFIASPSSFYQWRGLANVGGDDDNNSVSATGGGTLNLGGFFERKSATATTTMISGEEPHKKARSEAERADEAYQTAIKRVDQMRMIIEESLVSKQGRRRGMARVTMV
jgi:hypothetical protein